MENVPIGVRGGDANLYDFVHDSPIDNVDPFGLKGPGWWDYVTAGWNAGLFLATSPILNNSPSIRINSDNQDFYVCYRNTRTCILGDACAMHTDIFGSFSGLVYEGKGPPKKPAAPSGLPSYGYKCLKLPKVSTGVTLWGPLISCKNATAADILKCLQSKPG
jgi:hypothetical protein